MSVVYFVQHPTTKLIKIGVTKHLPTRLATLCREQRARLVVLGVRGGGIKTERELHRAFAPYRHHQEWFLPAQEIVDYIRVNTALPGKTRPLAVLVQEERRLGTTVQYLQLSGAESRTEGKRQVRALYHKLIAIWDELARAKAGA